MKLASIAGILAIAVAVMCSHARPFTTQYQATSQKTAADRAAQCPDEEGPNAPMTRAQGEEILKQLSAIRMLLQRQVPTTAAMGRPARIHAVTLPEGKGWHTLGNADAPVIMIEFTDLQCPFCRRFEAATFPAIKRNFIDTGKVRFVSLDLPLPMHAYALAAAEAEQCAAQQGKFWQFRDAVLSDQAPPTTNILQGHAAQLDLRTAEFQKCLNGSDGNAGVLAGRTAAAIAGVRGTPGFVVGRTVGGLVRGVAFSGSRALPFFEQYINEALGRSSDRPGGESRVRKGHGP